MAQLKLKQLDSVLTGSLQISGSAGVTGSLGLSGDILLDEDQRIYFEADKKTWIESNGANLIRTVANNQQMLLLDHETGNRAVFGNGTKVFIGEDNNALPSNTLEVAGNISASGAINTLSHISSSGNISSSGDLYTNNITIADTKTIIGTRLNISASNVLNLYSSKATLNSDLDIQGSLTASGNITASGYIQALNITASGIFNAGTDGYYVADTQALYASSGDLHLGNVGADTEIDGLTVTLNADTGAGGTSEIILDASSGRVSIKNLPTSDPGVADRLWRDGTDLKISVG